MKALCIGLLLLVPLTAKTRGYDREGRTEARRAAAEARRETAQIRREDGRIRREIGRDRIEQRHEAARARRWR